MYQRSKTNCIENLTGYKLVWTNVYLSYKNDSVPWPWNQKSVGCLYEMNSLHHMKNLGMYKFDLEPVIVKMVACMMNSLFIICKIRVLESVVASR